MLGSGSHAVGRDFNDGCDISGFFLVVMSMRLITFLNSGMKRLLRFILGMN